MNRSKLLLIEIAILSFLFLIIPSVSARETNDIQRSEEAIVAAHEYGQESSYYDGIITSFVSDIKLDEKGNADITEYITVYFPQSRHGIFRFIPNSTYLSDLETELKQPIKIKSVRYSRFDSSSYMSGYGKSKDANDYTILKIGDPDIYIQGVYLYEISYQMKNAVRILDQYDYQELYLDITGDQWELPILYSKAYISPVTGSLEAQCFTGVYGSTAQECTIEKNDETYTITSNISKLQGTELYSMTVGIKYEDGKFLGPSTAELLAQDVITFAPLAVLFAATYFSYSGWKKYGKDNKVTAVPPLYVLTEKMKKENLSTMQSLYKMQPSKAAVLAELLKGAQAGGLTIEYEKRKVYLSITPEQKEKLMSYIKTQPYFVRTLFKTLTSSYSTKTNIKDLSGVSTKMETMNNKANKEFTMSEYIDKKSTKKRSIFIAIAIVLLVIAAIIFFVFAELDPLRSFTWAGSFALSGLSFLIFSGGMLKRTQEGDAMNLDLLGLKRYMKAAELERLEFFNDPKKLISHFEELLPFAVILGLDKQWTKLYGPALKNLEYQPEWIRSDIPIYNALPRTYASLSRSINNSVNKISTPPQSSGSSGSSSSFGGGGFSGGGSGGGGGGSW